MEFYHYSPSVTFVALETSAIESLYGGQFTLSTQLIKLNYSLYYFFVRRVARKSYLQISRCLARSSGGELLT